MNQTWNRAAVAGAIVAAMAAPLVVLPQVAHADLSSAVESGSYGPIVSIVTPQYADVVHGASVAIAIAVQSRSNPATAVQMYVDDHIATPGWVPLKSLNSSKFNWNTSLFTNGPHKLTVRVVDSKGLIGQSEITVYVNNNATKTDALAPALKWLGVQNQQVLKGVVNLQLQANDNFGVKYIFVMINPANDPDRKPALRSWMINQPPYIIPFDTTNVNDGLYVLDALAYDALSNQGEATRLQIGIANHTINPTWFNKVQPEPTGQQEVEADNTQTTDPVNTSTPAPATESAANVTPPAAPAETAPADVDTPKNNANQLHIAQLDLPSAPQPHIPASSHQGNAQASSPVENSQDSSLRVEVVSSAQVQNTASTPQPRISSLPAKLMPVETNFKKDIAVAPVIDDKEAAAPLTTLASSKVAPSSAEPTKTSTAAPLREAALPSQTMPAQQQPAAPVAPPVSTLASSAAPASALTGNTVVDAEKSTRYSAASRNELSLPETSRASVAKAELPDFPQASLHVRTAKVPQAPVKSTFNAPALGIVDANVSSRMTPAAQARHASSRMVASAQLSSMPQRLASTAGFSAIAAVPGAPIFTAPASTSRVGSRIASASLSGSWGYQRVAKIGAEHSTKPAVALLPNFKANRQETGLAAITVSPQTSHVQVQETATSWPEVYVAKENQHLVDIAKRYHLPVKVLAINNDLKESAAVQAGQRIKMPRNLQVTYNGEPLRSDVSSMLVGTTSVAAFRFLFERQGGTVTWDAATQTVHAKNDNTEVTLTIGSNEAVVNQKKVMMDLASFLLSGRTMVPVRFFEQSMQAQVTWDPSTGRMFMAMAGDA